MHGWMDGWMDGQVRDMKRGCASAIGSYLEGTTVWCPPELS